MSVQSSIAICYGIIIDDEKLIEINQTLSDEESDELCDCSFLRQIDGWTGGDWFLGVINDLGELQEPYLLADLDVLPAQLELFEIMLEHAPWKDLIKWEPEKYLIQFWY